MHYELMLIPKELTMKLTRSRFRLISLLTACAFLLTAVFCAVSALRGAGISVPLPAVRPVPPASSAPSAPPAAETDAVPSPPPDGSSAPEMTTTPDQEYNLFGL